MRATLIAVIVVLILSVGICFLSLYVVQDAIYEMERISMEAIDAADAKDLSQAKEKMALLATTWEKYQPWLQTLTSHEDLHTIREYSIEASISLERQHFDDFYKAMALLAEALKHLHDQEPPVFSNIL